MPLLENHLRQKLTRGQFTRGLWVTLESPTISEIAVELGLDWIVIDAEHGHLDYKEIVEHLRATRGGTTTPLVRISDIEQGLIKRVLDLGAAGIIVPQVTGADDVARAVRFAKYPPQGIRGVGGERSTLWGSELEAGTRDANAQTLVIPLIETRSAFESLDAILNVEGVDALFVGPADLSASYGHLGQWEGPGVAERVLAIKDAAKARGLACGIMGTGVTDACRRRDQGFRMVGLASDTGLLIRGTREALAAFDGPRSIPDALS